MGVTAPIGAVDEPNSLRSSLGLTLWDMGHNAGDIRAFHRYLQAQGQTPASLLPAGELAAPDGLQKILVEPERLPAALRAGWQAEGDSVSIGSADGGPALLLPLHIERPTLYRLWIKFNAFNSGAGVTSIKIYKAGNEADGPVLRDLFDDVAPALAGPQWKDIFVDLAVGDYVIRLEPASPHWNVGDKSRGRGPRSIDCLYLTEALWNNAPSDAERAAMRDARPVSTVQWTSDVPLAGNDLAQWKWWKVRPISWELSSRYPKLFAQSRRFWREQIDVLAQQDYGKALPDYQSRVRQIIFDDTWNLVGNPVRIARQIAALRGGLAGNTQNTSYQINGSDFETEGAWQTRGTTLAGPYGNFKGTARAGVSVDQPGRYYVWTHFNNAKSYYAPWRLNVSAGNQTLTHDHDANNYGGEWQLAGTIAVAAPSAVNLEITPLPLRNKATARVIQGVVLTTQANFAPVGTVSVAMNRGQYAARIAATRASGYLAWLDDDPYQRPLSQDNWNKAMWPPQIAGRTQIETTKTVTLPPAATRAIQLVLRNAGDTPLQMNVQCGALAGTGGTFAGKVTWRVVGFSPYGAASLQWTPFFLLRRPFISVPPSGVAGVWLTINSQGVPAGTYTAPVRLSGGGAPDRVFTLRVRVSPVSARPRRPLIIGGYSNAIEGEAYARDVAAHGINMWWGELDKNEMQRRGIRLLALNVGKVTNAGTTDAIRSRIARLKAMGLDYGDWIFVIGDEPTGKTEDALKPFLDMAKAIRAADPQARISFNPGDTANIETFRILDPYCDFWIPYSVHMRNIAGQAMQRREIFTTKPWMWYSVVAYTDKLPTTPLSAKSQIRSVPATPGNPVGTALFSFYYPLRAPWDTGYEPLRDSSVFFLPGRNGPVATPAWEAIGEAIWNANLAQMVKERSADAPQAKELIASGSPEELLAWLERNGGGATNNTVPGYPAPKNPVLDIPAPDDSTAGYPPTDGTEPDNSVPDDNEPTNITLY